MSTTHDHSESRDRQRAMLRSAMGPKIAAALADPAVIEVMVNPDGALRLDRLGEGRTDTGVRIVPAATERIIRLVASHLRLEVHANNPIVSAELPALGEGIAGERFEGLLPPVATAPCFAIRKPAARIHTLGDYVKDNIVSAADAAILQRAVSDRKNILIVGGTSSGKTTLANALLAEIANRDERVIVIEDTRELQCAAPDCVNLRTKPGVASLADLVRSTLRLRPDRIIVGEVRGGEALIQEAVVTVPRRLIAEAIDLVVFIGGRGSTRRVETIAEVSGLTADGDYALTANSTSRLHAL